MIDITNPVTLFGDDQMILVKPVNYAGFVDADIMEMFTNDYERNKFVKFAAYEPLMAQLIKEMRRLNKHLSNSKEEQK